MKILDVALKDLLRSFRSVFAVVFMFILPLATAGLFYFAFGGLASDDGGFDLPVTRVQVVNLDQPATQFGSFSAGQMLVEFLQSEDLAGLVQVMEAPDEVSARAAVDRQEAGVAVIIPSDFTGAVFEPGGNAAVRLYKDPTLTIGPSIVKELVSRFVDGFAGTIIAADVVADQLDAQGLAADALLMQQVMAKYGAWAQAQGENLFTALDIQSPPSKAEPMNQIAQMLAEIIVAMTIFYAFFTGASTAQTILQEDEEGTLARLFTTPTPQATILGGKFIAVFVTLVVQIIVLMILSSLIFGIRWGQPLAVGLAMLGLVVAATGCGIMLMSFLKSTRQSGPVMGVVLTLTGMAGGLMTTGFQNLPPVFDTISRFTPQGWALQSWKLALAGESAAAMILPLAVMLGIGIVSFVVGALIFRRRFA
jgi:ABC-2 type transport system permease protein